MTCHPFADDVVLLAFGELPPERQAALAEHLRSCPACQEDLRCLEVLADLGRCDRRELDPQLQRRASQALRASLRSRRPRWAVPLAAAASLLLVAGVGWNLWLNRSAGRWGTLAQLPPSTQPNDGPLAWSDGLEAEMDELRSHVEQLLDELSSEAPQEELPGQSHFEKESPHEPMVDRHPDRGPAELAWCDRAGRTPGPGWASRPYRQRALAWSARA